MERDSLIRTLLIDGDGIIWRYASVGETRFNWGDGTQSYGINVEEAEVKEKALAHIEELKRDCDAGEAILYFSDWNKRNFRFQVDPTYRQNRSGSSYHKPPWITAVRETLQGAYPHAVKKRLEADDAIGIEATRRAKAGWDVVIVSRDKDLRQIPGVHHDWKTRTLVAVTEEQAEAFFYHQILVGDPADGYKGCPGIGPKKAEKYIGGLTDNALRWKVIVGLYMNAGLDEQDAIRMARLARILRDGDYNDDTCEIALWCPPGSVPGSAGHP